MPLETKYLGNFSLVWNLVIVISSLSAIKTALAYWIIDSRASTTLP
jgi:hypothetical protein